VFLGNKGVSVGGTGVARVMRPGVKEKGLGTWMEQRHVLRLVLGHGRGAKISGGVVLVVIRNAWETVHTVSNHDRVTLYILA